MTEQEQEKSQEKVLTDFSQQLQEFMHQVVLMHNRLSELENATAYLLSKDPQWIANFNASMAAEQEQSDVGPEKGLIQPEE